MESRGGWRVKVVGEWRGVGRRVVQSGGGFEKREVES